MQLLQAQLKARDSHGEQDVLNLAGGTPVR